MVHVSDGANIDVWGLGYMAGTPLMSKDWFLTADSDVRLLLNGVAPVRVADNIVTEGQTVVVGTTWHSDPDESENLKVFLNGLYARGAKAGDHAVFRINTDASQHGVSAGVRWGGSHRTDPDQRAKLTVTLPSEPRGGVLVIR